MGALLRTTRGAFCAAVALILGCSGADGKNGIDGKDGESCSVVDNGDGTKTVTCPGSDPVTIANGKDGTEGTSCTVTDNNDGTKTINCTDNTSVTISDGTPCSVVDDGGGTKTITCPGSDPVVVKDGSNCTVVDAGGGTSILSCDDGTKVFISPPIDTSLDPWEDLPGIVPTILAVGGGTNADMSFAPGDTMGVTFKVTTKSGKVIPLKEIDAAGIWVAGPNTNYQHIIPNTADEIMIIDVLEKATLNDDGSYTYKFDTAIPTDYGVPIHDTAKFTTGELKGPLDPGTYTVAMTFVKDYTTQGQLTQDANSTTYDFGLNTSTLQTRELVTVGNCNACHQRFEMHAGQFRSPTACVTCHTSGAEDEGSTDVGDPTPVTIDFRVMLHKIHNGFHLPSVQGLSTDDTGARVYGTGTPYVVGEDDYSAVLFPSFPNFNVRMPRDSGYSTLSSANKTKEDNVRTGVTSCFNCHGDPDGTGPLPAPIDGEKAYDTPSSRACGSCHDDLDYTKPYTANGQTMPANSTEAQCIVCHKATGALLSTKAVHLHPNLDTTISPVTTLNITSLTGGTGPNGNFVAGDSPVVSFTAKDEMNANVPITYFDSFSIGLTGPTQNRQVVIPGALTASPFDITGRLAAASTTNKGVMSKIYPTGTAVTETITVDFTSATAFNVSGSVSGALGSGALPASPSTFPTGASVSNIILSNTAVPQNITVTFSGPTTFTVAGSVSGAMGGGAFPASTSNTVRFKSTDNTVSFNIALGSTAAAAGNAIYTTVFKGSAANAGLFMIVAGRTSFAVADRFYFDFVAPAATYTMPVPMDLAFEYLGDADGNAGQVFTAGNLPVYRGRQTLWERTALTGAATSTNAASIALARYLFVNTIDPGLAANDYIVVEDGTGNEEYARVSGIDANLKRLQLQSPLRYAHAAGAAVQEATFTYRQEGAANYYVLNSAAGTITLNAAATAGNAFILSYRSDGRFGWKRKFGDTLQSWYFAPLQEAPGLDETWGDWRNKPLVDGTYTVAVWGYRSIEYQSGSTGAFEWQTYRDTTLPSLKNFLYGATATTLEPYTKIDNGENCNSCHDRIAFHGAGRLSADTCMMCHATPGPTVNFRTIVHGAHAEAFPVFPNGAGECSKCHGESEAWNPTNRSHPTKQTYPAKDWTIACTGCHNSSAAQAHADTMTASSGAEACETCHGWVKISTCNRCTKPGKFSTLPSLPSPTPLPPDALGYNLTRLKPPQQAEWPSATTEASRQDLKRLDACDVATPYRLATCANTHAMSRPIWATRSS
ncbi:MAG: hypothetical protein IPK82_36575 [Polyangiaceae bacterium]|nr:hypothetical protein [Polyangiaceae bacterium]